MDFSLQRHIRMAGSVASIVGVFISNWTLVLFGWTIVAIGYMIAHSKIEAYIESQTKPKKEDEDAIR